MEDDRLLNEERRELALKLLSMRIEGSFSTAFLEAYIRADSENTSLLNDDFDVFRKKFSWDEKVAMWKP